jgi:membrane protease YdiL (CAAX protease family)
MANTLSMAAPCLRGPKRPLAILSWLVIVASIAVLMIQAAERPESADPQPPDGADPTLTIQARMVLAQEAMAPGTGMTAFEEIDLSNNPDRRLRLAGLAAAIEGPEAGRKIVAEVQAGLSASGIVPTEFQASAIDGLDRVFAGTASAATLDAVRADLGWFGQLAILASQDGGEGRQSRLASQFGEAMTMMVTIVTGLFIFGGVGLLGFVLLIFGIVKLAQGQLKSRLSAGSTHDGVYAETFALWLIMFQIILIFGGVAAYALEDIAGDVAKEYTLAVTIVGFFLSLIVLAWPVARGVPWKVVRSDIGWTSGQGVCKEFGCGLLGYAGAIPIAAIGMLISLLLILFAAPNEGAAAASHPIVGELAGGGWAVRIQVLLLASVAAPIVEETMFRGVLYRQLRMAAGRWAPWLSVVVAAGATSLVFALIHPQGLLAVPALMSLAIAFSLAREWRGSLIAPMVMHGVSNGAVMALLMVLAG